LQGQKAATYSQPLGSSADSVAFLATDDLDEVTPSTYFIYRTELSIVSHEIITQLYCASTIKVKWKHVQDQIEIIDKRLTRWREHLPKKFNIDFDMDGFSSPDWKDPYFYPSIGLALFLATTRMHLYRPFLCRFNDRLSRQSHKSQHINQFAVEECIMSARKMISLLCWSCTTVDQIYTISPWWSTLENLCAALSVLMLEMAFQCQHMDKTFGGILADAKRGITWLSRMASVSISARKAWEVFDKLIRLVKPLGEHTISDLPLAVPMPPGYAWDRWTRPRPDLLNVSQPNPLSQANLQKFQEARAIDSASDAQATWPSQPPFQTPFAQPPHSEQRIPTQDVFGNHLDDAEALARFSSMGRRHSNYDDSWNHMFAPITTVTNIPIYNTQPFEGIPVEQSLNPADVFHQGASGDTYSQFQHMNTGATFPTESDVELMDETTMGQLQGAFDPYSGDNRFGA
jgi:hypothetical protein